LKRHYGAERILIMDWDVHHGNGTQDAFFTDPTVLYLSTHQFPFYPGTGSIEETGEAEGAGYTVNVPLPSGCGDAEYLEVFQRVVIPIASRYEPQWVLVSAGFDPHRDDPLAGMRVTEQGFGAMAASLLELAERFSGGRIAFLLEGGYNLLALKSSVATVLQTMAGEVKSPLPVQTGGVKIDALIRKVLKIQEEYRQKDSRSRRSTY
ncbi:MAG TPA: histone deacetylase, partial [Candidatus Binatia bacterium]